ncbi:MAG: PEP/pyruvate-binding domain-containing protein [Desulfobacterales bacterium]|nr:PEP/pyruvate-binding domain-containing protein [Desulfobacterales bacterium]
MLPSQLNYSDHFDLSFKVFHELMAKRVSKILLVSSPYDAFTMEEDGRLAERIIHEYRGLNLTRPPRLTWVSTAQEALDTLATKPFDLVLTMPHLDDMNAYALGRAIKQKYTDLFVYLLTQMSAKFMIDPKYADNNAIDKIYVWRGNTDLLLAIIKNIEDQMNVAYDTQRANVRVIILVEDSPFYRSSILPLLYKEIVMQTQAVMEDSLNEEHRIVRMRARPKILVAEDYEQAIALYQQYNPFLQCVLSDVRYPREGQIDPAAGFKFLSMIHTERPEIPLLMQSSEDINRDKAARIPAVFLNKNSPVLHDEIRSFFVNHLGFGDFVFRLPDGTEVARASNMHALEKILPTVPDESVWYHALRHGFSSWLMARSEIAFATRLRRVQATDFANARELKQFLIDCIRERRKGRQRGVITDFSSEDFDPDTDFLKIGKGSLGGKARGLAFASTLLEQNRHIRAKYKDVTIHVPKTLVISTEGFDAFIKENDLQGFSGTDLSDEEIKTIFLDATFPDWLTSDLELFLRDITYPLAVRSSSLLEDAKFQPFAGIYQTFMIPNNHPELNVRLGRLIKAIKLVYASTYLATSRSYAKSTLHRTEEEKMAVVVQKLTGQACDHYFYPAISGVAQSYNFYPIGHLKSEDGIAHLAMGLGKTVVEGGTALRFSPKHPQFLPQFSTVDNILENAQRFFYALNLSGFPDNIMAMDDATLEKLEVDDFTSHAPIQRLASTYFHADHRIRDALLPKGFPILTFASILKHKSIPLPEILTDILKMGRKGMASPVEIEFALDLTSGDDGKPEFALLQIRPMALSQRNSDITITKKDIRDAFCYSTSALGNGTFQDIEDIVFVKPESFDPAQTSTMAAEIGKVNGDIAKLNRKFLLIGPGRWGSADRWLGIPVKWQDISGVGAIVETYVKNLNADPSQGSHFFHNITSLGISYLTLSKTGDDFLDQQWLDSLKPMHETNYLRHVRLEKPIKIKIDGKKSLAVLLR